MSSPLARAKIASFSYERSTSPVPPWNAVVASRALPGSALALANSFLRYASASASLPPFAMTDWYAARTLQRAPPDEPGLGVTMPTPGLTRSANDWMFLGLPLRTTIDTTVVDKIPWWSFWSQSLSTSLSSTRRVVSGVSEKCVTSALRPLTTARLWSPDGPYDSLNVTPLPASVLANAFSSAPSAAFGVE